MRYLKLTIAYDGTAYVGWQVQTNGISIQQRMEEAWLKVTQEPARVIASGRTDAGVHAWAQVCSVTTDCSMKCHDLQRALNAETPFDVSVLQVEEAAAGFHAITDAVEKTYLYHIQYGRILNPLRRDYCWYIPVELQVDAINEAASYLLGRHDFSSFESAGAERTSSIRTVKRLEAEPENCHQYTGIKITISADGFLYKMVRNIVGSLVRVGRGTEKPEWIEWVRDQHDRKVACQAAPAHGLFLDHVVYDDHV